MGALISLFISLFMMLVSLTISLTMTMLNLLVSLVTRSIPRSRPRSARATSSVVPHQGGRTSRIGIIVIALFIALVIDGRLALFLAIVLFIVWLVRRGSRHLPAVEPGELSRLYQGVSLMSGAQFEAFMATLFRAMGHEVTVLGGTGDQGADILITTADKQRVAVQCKNYNKPVGNTPVQEVFAGATHYKCDHAWVVAPRGYTRGAVELSKSIGVSLFDDTGIRAWIKEVDTKIAAQQAQQEEGAEAQAGAAPDLEREREDYDKLLQYYRENLDVLENLYKHKREHAHSFHTNPSLLEQWSSTYEQLDANIKDTLAKMDLLEGCDPKQATEERVARRADLTSRHMKLENTYSLQDLDIPDQIRKLAKLRDDGLLSKEEFEAKKAELLERL